MACPPNCKRTPPKFGSTQDVDTVSLKRRLNSNLSKSRKYDDDVFNEQNHSDDEFGKEEVNRRIGIARSDSLQDARSGKLKVIFGDLAKRRRKP